MDTKTFTPEEILIGDQVYFEAPGLQNHGLYWKVVAKTPDNMLQVENNDLGYRDINLIQISSVTQVNHLMAI